MYTGKHHEVSPELTLIAYEGINYINKIISVDQLDEIDHLKGVKWLNVTGLSQVDVIKAIGDKYGIDPMILEDVVHVEQRTKVEFKETDYLFAVFKMIYIDDLKSQEEGMTCIRHEHISFLLIGDLIISFQEEPGDVFDGVRDRISDTSRKIRDLKTDYLFYALIDAIVDHQMETMLSLQDDTDTIEEMIIDDELEDIEALYHLRKSLMVLKSGAFPIQETIMRLIGQDIPLISKETKEYFKDVQDHVTHLSDRIMTNREVVSSLFDMHQTNISNNMNSAMTTLTIFSAIFIPLSFLAGFFGMNFQVFPSLATPNGIPIFIGGCLVIAVSMLSYFKWKKWF